MKRNSAIVCAPVLPEFDRESGSRRLLDWLLFLRDQGWQVSFACRSGQAAPRYVRILHQLGIATHTGITAEKTEQLFSLGRFNLAVCAFWYLAEEYLPVIRAVSPDTRVIVDSIDLHFMRKSREQFCPASAAARPGLDEGFGSEMVRELNAYAAADAVLTVSQKEADLIGDLLNGATPTYVTPDCEDLPPSSVPPDERKGIVFIGNFRHPPNVTAVEYLCAEIVPRLASRVLEQHPLMIVGNAMTDRIAALSAGHPHVRMVGWVPSVVPYLMHARVSVVPLLYGAGTKRKLIQALMVGTPSVATTIAIEGLNLENERDILVADDPGSFAQAIEYLVSDTTRWQRIAAAGATRIHSTHSRSSAIAHFECAVRKTVQTPCRTSRTSVGSADAYLQLIDHLCAEVNTHVPEAAVVAVVNRGDRRLLDLKDRQAFDFPLSPEGSYLGYHPADGTEAIGHLQTTASRWGCEYLVFPASAFWWLEHYDDLRNELATAHVQIWDSEYCRIYRLTCSGPADLRRAAIGTQRGSRSVIPHAPAGSPQS